MPAETIGDWTTPQLVKFMEETLRQSPPSRIPELISEDLTVANQLTISDEMQLSQRQSTVGSAGGATALPATPTGYFIIKDYTGQNRAVPYYDVN